MLSTSLARCGLEDIARSDTSRIFNLRSSNLRRDRSFRRFGSVVPDVIRVIPCVPFFLLLYRSLMKALQESARIRRGESERTMNTARAITVADYRGVDFNPGMIRRKKKQMAREMSGDFDRETIAAASTSKESEYRVAALFSFDCLGKIAQIGDRRIGKRSARSRCVSSTVYGLLPLTCRGVRQANLNSRSLPSVLSREDR